MACPFTPLSIAAICCAGSASPSPTPCAASKHLTRSRAVSRKPGRFSRRFLSLLACACPRTCLYANWAGLVLENGKPRPPATYAVRWLPVRHARADSGWGGKVGASQRMPLWLFPMRPRNHLPRNSGDRAPGGAQSPHLSSRVGSVSFTTRSEFALKWDELQRDGRFPSRFRGSSSACRKILVSSLRAEPGHRCPARG